MLNEAVYSKEMVFMFDILKQKMNDSSYVLATVTDVKFNWLIFRQGEGGGGPDLQ